MSTLERSVENFIESYIASVPPAPKEGAATIHVDEIATKLATFYERVRALIDYQEEHLLRKSLIGRVLKRRVLLRDVSQNIAEGVIKDIIRAGHLLNDAVPEEKIVEVGSILTTFLSLSDTQKKLGFGNGVLGEWLLNMTANAVEEALFPPTKDTAIANFMFTVLRQKLAIKGADLPNDEINLQLFIAIQKALLRVDRDLLSYRLLKFVYPNWNAFTSDEVDRVARELPAIKENIEKSMTHPKAPHFFKLINRYNTVFYLLGDALDTASSTDDLKKTFGDSVTLATAVEAAYQKRYTREKNLLGPLAFFSVISFLLSKIAVAFAVEIPIDAYFGNFFSLPHVVVNIAFAPLLMLIIVMAIHLPSSKNFALVWKEIEAIVYGSPDKRYTVVVPERRSLGVELIVQFFYLIVFLGVFYIVVDVLLSYGFTVASTVIFVFFTSLVAATGVKIHNRAKEMSFEERKPTVFSFILDVVSMPFVSVGQVGIAGLAKFNVLVMLVNFIIELPFQIFVEFIENFRSFLKSKKETIT